MLYRTQPDDGSSVDTHTATFEGAQVRVVRGWPSSDDTWTLPALMRSAEQARRSVAEQQLKKHHTPGFFSESVRSAAEDAHAAAGEEIRQRETKDWGRFADIGRHTNCLPPTTCWSLVVVALEATLALTVRLQVRALLLTTHHAAAPGHSPGEQHSLRWFR